MIEKPLGFSAPIGELVGEQSLVSRLMELGLVRGELVILRGRAPFGGPYLVEIRGSLIALRSEEALCLLV
ncbi:MAG: ferrous iron transport protein A [Bdellovibrionales bacterium]|nr:ferrous iron transport protein A [Bdellovibrionales bacterium]